MLLAVLAALLVLLTVVAVTLASRSESFKNALQSKNPRKCSAKRKLTAEELKLEEARTDLTLRFRVAYFLLGIFALNTVSALAVVFLVGFGLMVLSNAVIISLIGETVAHAAAMFLTVTKYLFPTK